MLRIYHGFAKQDVLLTELVVKIEALDSATALARVLLSDGMLDNGLIDWRRISRAV